jgi:hypothetical protein
MSTQQKVISLLQSASRDLNDAESSIRSGESSNDSDYIHSILSQAKRQVDDAKRDIGNAERIIQRSLGDKDNPDLISNPTGKLTRCFPLQNP